MIYSGEMTNVRQLRGEEWLTSKRRRRFEIAAASAISIPATALALAASSALYLEHGDFPLIFQNRIGHDQDNLLRMPKLKTLSGPVTNGLSPNGHNHERAGPVGKSMRKYHIDELPQLPLIMTGRMSVVGPRPLTPVEYEQTMDELSPQEQTQFIEAKKMAKPGVVWPGSDAQHTQGIDLGFHDKALETIEFAQTASFESEVALISRAVKAIVA